jgi:small-conductance mechanosensitive channel
MSTQPGVFEQLATIYHHAVTSALEALPRLLAGLATIAVMVIAAKLVERVLRTILTGIRFDALLQQAGVDKTLHRIGLRQSINVVLPRLVYFLLLCLIARIGADLLGLQAVSDAFTAFFAYLPNIVAAVLLLVAGSAASQFAGGIVTAAAREANIDFARPLGSLVGALIMFVVGIMALAQLKINTDIIHIVTICSLSALTLAFGLSFGLGTRALTRDVVAGFYARKLFQPGDALDVAGVRGTLRTIAATQTVLDADQQMITIANTTLLRSVVRAQTPPPPPPAAE